MKKIRQQHLRKVRAARGARGARAAGAGTHGRTARPWHPHTDCKRGGFGASRSFFQDLLPAWRDASPILALPAGDSRPGCPGGLWMGAQHQLPMGLLLGMLLPTAWGCPGTGRLGVLGRVWGVPPPWGEYTGLGSTSLQLGSPPSLQGL